MKAILFVLAMILGISCSKNNSSELMSIVPIPNKVYTPSEYLELTTSTYGLVVKLQPGIMINKLDTIRTIQVVYNTGSSLNIPLDTRYYSYKYTVDTIGYPHVVLTNIGTFQFGVNIGYKRNVALTDTNRFVQWLTYYYPFVTKQ